jgi:hypothetical protein
MAGESNNPNGDLFEDKFARVYADIKRLDQLRISETASSEQLTIERVRRLDERLNAQETAVSAALAAAEKAVAAALSASDKAVTKAEIAQAKVNETQNEFRGSLRDQAATQMPRQEAENVFRELRALLATQATATQTLTSRIDVGPPSLSVLQARSDNQIGRREGIGLTANMIVAFATVIIGVIGAIAAVLIATH